MNTMTDRICGCPITPADRIRDLELLRHNLAACEYNIEVCSASGEKVTDELRAWRWTLLRRSALLLRRRRRRKAVANE